MPDDRDSPRSGVGDRTRTPAKLFEIGEGVIIGNQLSLHTASKSGQSGGSTEPDHLEPVMHNAGPTMPSGDTIRHS